MSMRGQFASLLVVMTVAGPDVLGARLPAANNWSAVIDVCPPAWQPLSDEMCRLAAADGDPRRAGARSNQGWPDRECPAASALTCGVLKAESSRTPRPPIGRFPDPRGRPRKPASCAAVRASNASKARSWSWSSPRRRDIRSSTPISPTAPISAMAASRSTVAAAASSFPSRPSHALPRRTGPRSTITVVSICRQIPFHRPLGRTASSRAGRGAGGLRVE